MSQKKINEESPGLWANIRAKQLKHHYQIKTINYGKTYTIRKST